MSKKKVHESKVLENEFKGQPLFSIFEVDEDGEKCYEKPIVSFGIKKAQHLIVHLKELEGFVLENS